jgi:diguanylate cyclase (GGDEF)-like protein
MKFLKQFTLRQKTIAATTILVLVLLAVTLISLASFSTTQAKLKKVTSQYQPKMLSALQLTSHFYHSLSVLGNYLIEKDDYNMSLYRQKVKDINETLADLVKLTNVNPELDDSEQLLRIKNLVDEIINHNTLMLDLALNNNKNMPAIGIATKHLEPIAISMNQNINDLLVAAGESQQAKIIPLIENLRFNWIMLVSEVRNYLAFRKGFTINEIKLFTTGVNQAFEELSKYQAELDSDQEDLLDEFEHHMLSYQDSLIKAIDIHAGNNWRADRQLLRKNITPTLRKLTFELEILVTKQQQRIQKSNAELSDEIRNAEQIIRLSIQIALAITLLVLFLSYRNRRLASDIHGHQENERKMRHQAHHDSLTSLANRAFFDEKLLELLQQQEATLQNAQTNEDNPDEFFGLLYVDLDGFKDVNDHVGHDAGDFILSEVATRMQHAVRTSDIVCRLGGDEFAVLIQGVLRVSLIEKIAENLCKEISADFHFKDKILNVSASIGVTYSTHPKLSQYDTVSDRMNAMIKQADQAMYQAKKNGKNQFCRCE